MEYVILKDEETGKIEKIGRFLKNGIAEQFCDDHWESDASLYSLQFDGLLEEISKIEARKIIVQQMARARFAARISVHQRIEDESGGAIHAHPTVSESKVEAAEGVDDSYII